MPCNLKISLPAPRTHPPPSHSVPRQASPPAFRGAGGVELQQLGGPLGGEGVAPLGQGQVEGAIAQGAVAVMR